jgi:hypothetical protein
VLHAAPHVDVLIVGETQELRVGMFRVPICRRRGDGLLARMNFKSRSKASAQAGFGLRCPLPFPHLRSISEV